MKTKLVKITPPTFGFMATIAIALLENGTLDGKAEGKAMVMEMGAMLDALNTGDSYQGSFMTHNTEAKA